MRSLFVPLCLFILAASSAPVRSQEVDPAREREYQQIAAEWAAIQRQTNLLKRVAV